MGAAPRSVYFHVGQRGLQLGQPEGHLHDTVEAPGPGPLGPGLLLMVSPGIQRPQAVVAVGLERAHPQLFGQDEGLAVMGFGRLGIWRLTLCHELTQEPPSPGFVAPFFAGPDEVEGLHGQAFGLLHATGQQEGLALPDDSRREGTPAAHRGVLLHDLLKQRQGLGQPPRERIESMEMLGIMPRTPVK
jgi:hypothetical protein